VKNSPARARRAARRGASSKSIPLRLRADALGAPVLRAVPPDVRWSRVATAKVRIAADFYRRRDVRDRLIDALIDELGRSRR